MKKVKIKRASRNNSTYFYGGDKWSLIYGNDKEDKRKSEYYGCENERNIDNYGGD